MRIFITLCSWIVAATAAAQALELSDAELRVSDHVLLTGSLRVSVLAPLADTNAVVLDLRGSDEEGVAASVRAIEAARIERISMPLGRVMPDPSEVARFTSVLDATTASGQPLIVQCSSGNRAGMLWAAYLIDTGTTPEAALQAVDPIVTKEPAREAILGYGGGE